MAEPITAPDGRTWTVRRRWVPRLGTETLWGRFHRRYRQTIRRTRDAADASPDGCLEVVGEGLGEAIVVLVAVIVVVLLLVFVGFPLLFALFDLIIVSLLALLGTLARVVLRRPWVIDAHADDGTHLTWRVVGWTNSNDELAMIRQRIQGGVDPNLGAPSS